MPYEVELTGVEFIRQKEPTKIARGNFAVTISDEHTAGLTKFTVEAAVYGGDDDPETIPKLRRAFHAIMQALADQTKSWT